MNDIYWHEDIRIKEQLSRTKMWMAFCYILFLLYCGLLFIEALFLGGEMRLAVITVFVASPLPITPTIVYFRRLSMKNIPMVVAIATVVVFLVFGTYLEGLTFYYFVIFIALGTVMVMKDFKMLLKTTIIIIVINLIFIIAVVPRLEWLTGFDFTMQFAFFVFGSVLFLILTHNVDTKETGSDRALAAFTALLDSTPNLMAITDSSRRVYYLSNQFLKFIGYPRKEYTVGQPLIDLISDWRMKMIFADMLDTDGFYETEIDLDIDGVQRHFKLTTDRLTGGFDGIFVDISDITPIYLGRIAAEEANRSKSRFLATMSHEIRTPLNAIIGITQIELQKDTLPEENRFSLEKVNSAGNNLLGIINDILDMSKIETGNMEIHSSPYDVPSLLNDAVQLNIVRIGAKPINFILDVDEYLPSRMIGDELRLKQILNNLLSNAVKYTDKGEIKLAVSASYENVEDGADTGADLYLTFVVSDTGQGMRSEDLDKLFLEQYVRLNAEANRTTEGTGLGLGITKRLIEMMSGTIAVSSKYGQGSIFTVKVRQKSVDGAPPIGAQTANSLREFSYIDRRLRDRRKIVRNIMPYGRVLVVDDSASNLYVAEGLLSPYKLKIETVDSGFAAIEKVERGEKYDIIFMDHMMPRMDGIETTQKLRRMGYTDAIVALTANALAGNEAMFADNGFDGFIPKPIDTRRLDKVLNEYVRDRHYEEAQFYRTERDENTERRKEAAAEPVIPEQLIEVFCKEAIENIGVLREATGKKDLKTITITTHALKSALANIGRRELSAQAARLEEAGRDGETAYIDANIGGFIGALEELVGTLQGRGTGNGERGIGEDGKKIGKWGQSPFTENEKNAERGENADNGGPVKMGKNLVNGDSPHFPISAEDVQLLKQQLAVIIAACDEYDDTAVYNALDRLGEKQWNHEIAGVLKNVRSALYLNSDFETAAETAKAGLEKMW